MADEDPEDGARRPWLGPLGRADARLVERLERHASFRALMGRGWPLPQTLLFAPRFGPGLFRTELFVVGRLHAWDGDPRSVWLFSTIGLTDLPQAPAAGRHGFHRFELLLALNDSEADDPFPAQIAAALTHEPEGLAGFDWDHLRHPPLLTWLARIGQDFAGWLGEGITFAATDTLRFGPGGHGWTRSRLDHAALLPAPPQAVAAGLGPFSAPGDPWDVCAPADWPRADEGGRFEHGFYWLLPLSAAEHRLATSLGTWSLLERLVRPSDDGDRFEDAFDLMRGAPRVS